MKTIIALALLTTAVTAQNGGFSNAKASAQSDFERSKETLSRNRQGKRAAQSRACQTGEHPT
jgi:hypothetical protein